MLSQRGAKKSSKGYIQMLFCIHRICNFHSSSENVEKYLAVDGSVVWKHCNIFLLILSTLFFSELRTCKPPDNRSAAQADLHWIWHNYLVGWLTITRAEHQQLAHIFSCVPGLGPLYTLFIWPRVYGCHYVTWHEHDEQLQWTLQLSNVVKITAAVIRMPVTKMYLSRNTCPAKSVCIYIFSSSSQTN